MFGSSTWFLFGKGENNNTREMNMSEGKAVVSF